MPDQIPATPEVRIDIRLNGRIYYTGVVYNPHLDLEPDTVSFTADLEPTMIDAPPPPPPRNFDDPRDGDKVITFVHSGRRDKEIP